MEFPKLMLLESVLPYSVENIFGRPDASTPINSKKGWLFFTGQFADRISSHPSRIVARILYVLRRPARGAVSVGW